MHKMARGSSSFTVIHPPHPSFAAPSILFMLLVCCSFTSSSSTAAAAGQDPYSDNNNTTASPLPLRDEDETEANTTDFLNPQLPQPAEPQQLPHPQQLRRREQKAQLLLPLKEGASHSQLQGFGGQDRCMYEVTFKTSCSSAVLPGSRPFAVDILDKNGHGVTYTTVHVVGKPCESETFKEYGGCASRLCFLEIRGTGLEGWQLKYVRVDGGNKLGPVYFCIGEALGERGVRHDDCKYPAIRTAVVNAAAHEEDGDVNCRHLISGGSGGVVTTPRT